MRFLSVLVVFGGCLLAGSVMGDWLDDILNSMPVSCQPNYFDYSEMSQVSNCESTCGVDPCGGLQCPHGYLCTRYCIPSDCKCTCREDPGPYPILIDSLLLGNSTR